MDIADWQSTEIVRTGSACSCRRGRRILLTSHGNEQGQQNVLECRTESRWRVLPSAATRVDVVAASTELG
jgi:hypothetical protein